MEIQNWKDIKGYEGYYQVSDLGNVRSLDRKITAIDGKIVNYKGKILDGSFDRDGYRRVGLYKGKDMKNIQVHRLVAISFLGEETGKVVNHKDSNPSNNKLSNLEWVTNQENCIHSFRNGNRTKGELHRWAILTQFQIDEIPNLRNLGYSLHQISKLFNVSYSCIKNIVAKRNWNYSSNNSED